MREVLEETARARSQRDSFAQELGIFPEGTVQVCIIRFILLKIALSVAEIE